MLINALRPPILRRAISAHRLVYIFNQFTVVHYAANTLAEYRGVVSSVCVIKRAASRAHD